MNNRIFSEVKTEDQPNCNCQEKVSCPAEENCFHKELIYQFNLKENTTSDRVNYNGLTENIFKERLYKRRNSFKYESKVNSTEAILALDSYWSCQTTLERINKVEYLFNWNVSFFNIARLSHWQKVRPRFEMSSWKQVLPH